MSEWQTVFKTAFFCVGVKCDEAGILSLAYLPRRHRSVPPQNLLAAECRRQVLAYFRQPAAHCFDLPLYPAKTAFQNRVRELIRRIPCGSVLSYGEISRRLKNSSPRAVGGACRANPIPLIVPCHRVVAANGLGGFMGEHTCHLPIKKRLLRHENALSQ